MNVHQFLTQFTNEAQKLQSILKRVRTDTSDPQQTEYVHRVFEYSNDAIFLINPFQDRIITVNRKACIMLGYTRDELLSLRVSDIHPHEMPQLYAFANSVGEQGSGWTDELTCLTKSGNSLPAEISASTTEVGGEWNLIIMVRDISQRKQAEEALRESEKKYRDIFESAHDLIFLASKTGDILDMNRRGEELTGYSRDELLQMNVLEDLIVPEDQRTIQQVIHDVFEGKERIYQVRWRSRAGDIVHFEGVSNAQQRSGGGFASTRCILRDLTHRKRAEEAFHTAQLLHIELEKEKELSDLKNRFVSIVSHEYRTPLAIIQSCVDILQIYDNKLTDEKRQEKLDRIRSQVKQMTDLVDKILLMAKAEAVGLKFAPQWLNLDTLFGAILSDMRDSATDQLIELSVVGNVHPVYLDSKLVQLTVRNLVSNAIKYSPTQSTVAVALHYLEDKIIFSVSDNGIGIPKKDQGHLFAGFHRAGNVGDISGTGLGLAITRQAVEAHGGTISFQSTESVGTTFTVSIPTSAAAN